MIHGEEKQDAPGRSVFYSFCWLTFRVYFFHLFISFVLVNFYLLLLNAKGPYVRKNASNGVIFQTCFDDGDDDDYHYYGNDDDDDNCDNDDDENGNDDDHDYIYDDDNDDDDDDNDDDDDENDDDHDDDNDDDALSIRDCSERRKYINGVVSLKLGPRQATILTFILQKREVVVRVKISHSVC